ncbi:LOW QUALITY PROTEIN: uncharacterized protein ppp1r18 [Sphaeramia orbicularis]|uniref:LOW QUALITY PROTEIN: uncharacterized protein ppp1r18 n=1 Tax=Sphaeramia orbicularis TaxID=375764 RepID=UPI00117D5F68|nr:LOW QUALITY PROTEIN: uncharacterized protein LOC115428374 [Sphaeramia orbicularis]
MSVSSLPEWKQLLLEKKRREEEERERREKEEEEKFASMPAWKRGIIQRRKARQESLGDREKDREVCVLQVDVRSLSDGLSDTDSSVTVNLGSELSLSPDPGLWMDSDNKQVSQVSVETIVPVHENPFIRTQSSWKKGRDSDAEKGNESEVKEREKTSPRGHDVESGSGRDIELRIERFRDLSEGRDKERSRDRSQGREGDRYEKSSQRESGKDRELLKVRKDEEEKEVDPSSPVFSPHPCLRTIRADNIIIIEQDRKSSDERRGRWREAERERAEEDHQAKRGLKMGLREILAGGGSVTEIRASEVLIIKPSVSPEEGNPGKGREDAEVKGREYRADMSWLREKVKESAKEKERPWGQATVIKEDRKDSLDDNVFVDRGGRVSKLLSKFGEHPKPPSRSKSSDNFLRPGRRKHSGDDDDDDEEFVERRADGRSVPQIPKRSFSFSDRVFFGKENGLDEDGWKMRERIHSDKSVPKETAARIKMGCARLLDKDRFGRYKDKHDKDDRNEVKKVEPVDKRAAEKAADAEGDEGFTVASVKNTEGISFARRLPIRQDGKGRAEREVKRLPAEKSLEREVSVEKDAEKDVQICDKKDFQPEGSENTVPAADESHHRHESAFADCSSLLCTVPDAPKDLHKGPDWNGQRASYLSHSVLSQHTEELISKIEKIGDTTVYSTERKERPCMAPYDVTQESNQESLIDVGPDMLKPPKRISNMGVHPGPLEIQIPRTVFYVAEDMVEKKKADEGQEWEGGKGVERRDSWRIGKPLSRIESLREKIRQRELEKLRQKETQDGEQGDGADMCDNVSTTAEERGTEAENEWEAAAHMRKRLVEAETGQEEVEGQTSMAAYDVTQEVLKTCHQLPVSVSEAVSGEELTNNAATAAAAASELYSDTVQLSDDEEDPLKYVEEELKRYRETESLEDHREEEISEEEEEERYTLTVDSEQSLSPSPPHPNSLAAMSRIYNLEAVGSRSGLCLRDRTVDIPSVHLVKVKPLISQQENSCGVQNIQRQIEHFQLKEQEVLKSQNAGCTSPRRDKETKGQHSPRGVLKQVKTMSRRRRRHKRCQIQTPEFVLQHLISSKTKLSPSHLRLPVNPENTLKPSDYAPTPASSPCSPSPAQSPNLSPSPSPSPTLFSIRSASGGQVKRGATITITPKKPSGGGRGGGAIVSTPAGLTAMKTPSQTANTGAEPAKKKYPTVDEIEVIGGYLHLEKSCLVKNRGTPKRVKVCFDEDQLEQVCEYPSETSMLVCSPFPHDVGRTENPQGDEEQEEETEAETATNVSKNTRNTGTATGRGVRVNQCHPLLKKHSV